MTWMIHPNFANKTGKFFTFLCNVRRNFREFKVATACSVLESEGMEIPAIAAIHQIDLGQRMHLIFLLQEQEVSLP